MKKTLLFMIQNISVRNATLYIIGAILGIVLSDIIINGWQGIAELSREFIMAFPISIGIIFIILYINAKGKMDCRGHHD